MLDLLRKNAKFFLAAALAGLALRLFWVLRFPGVVDDSRLYTNIAVNWLQHGVYGISDSGRIMPTLSRLPGYPAFLAAIFAIFGVNNFRAVLLIEVVFDLGTCLLIADIARRMFSERAAKASFLLAALCPFLANYSAAVLTETLETFFTTLALDLAICGLHLRRDERKISTRTWLACGLAVGTCMLLRPDGGILYGAIAGYMLLLILSGVGSAQVGAATSRAFLSAGLLVTAGAFFPLVPWTIRNLHTLHRFEPLAPRYANDVDETVMPGFNRWTRTWMAEYASTQDIYWEVPGGALDISKLPSRAFDSPEQRGETAQLFDEYNAERELTPEIDARFGGLAAARIRDEWFRYYIWLPALRITDMWLRPRIELLPSDPKWWEFDDEPVWLAVSIAFGLIGLFYVGLGVAGGLRSRAALGMGMFFLFVLMRSLFLGTLENPEPRYTLECYPVVLVAAAAVFREKSNGTNRKSA